MEGGRVRSEFSLCRSATVYVFCILKILGRAPSFVIIVVSSEIDILTKLPMWTGSLISSGVLDFVQPCDALGGGEGDFRTSE